MGASEEMRGDMLLRNGEPSRTGTVAEPALGIVTRMPAAAMRASSPSSSCAKDGEYDGVGETAAVAGEAAAVPPLVQTGALPSPASSYEPS